MYGAHSVLRSALPNAGAPHMASAQVPPQRLQQVPGIEGIVDAVVAYSQRHYDRTEQLLQVPRARVVARGPAFCSPVPCAHCACPRSPVSVCGPQNSFLIDYTLKRMDALLPAAGTAVPESGQGLARGGERRGQQASAAAAAGRGLPASRQGTKRKQKSRPSQVRKAATQDGDAATLGSTRRSKRQRSTSRG